MAGAAALSAAPALLRPVLAATEPMLNDDGLHVQPWFLQSFLEMREDLDEAAAAGKRLAVIWEQKGCPYCRETHRVNFADKRISSYITANFELLQLDLWGSRKVTDFDGEELSEKKLAEKWGVRFTPTTIFFPTLDKLPAGVSGKKAEIARMPGYMKPFHFMSMYQFVQEQAYLNGKFGPYVRKKINALKSAGKSPENW